VEGIISRRVVVAVCMAVFCPHAVAQAPLGGPTLEDELKNGLRVRRPQDVVFLNRVVQLVRNGQLPLRLVRSTFQRSRRRYPRYPFPYFQLALRTRAKQIGVSI